MSVALINLLGGVLGGIGQGKRLAQQAQEKKEMMGLQKQLQAQQAQEKKEMMGLQKQLMQVQLADKKLKQNLINLMMQGQKMQAGGPAATSTETELSGTRPTQLPEVRNLSGEMAKMQSGNIAGGQPGSQMGAISDPASAGLLEYMTGIPFLRMMEMDRAQGQRQFSQKKDVTSMALDMAKFFGGWKTIKYIDDQDQEQTAVVPQYMPPAQVQQMLGNVMAGGQPDKGSEAPGQELLGQFTQGSSQTGIPGQDLPIGGPARGIKNLPSFRTGLAPVEIRKRSDKTGQEYEVAVNKRTGKEIGQRMHIKPLKGESAEASAKIALANQGIQHAQTLENMFINPDGTINTRLIWEARSPMGGIGQGRLARTTFMDALDARARAATGAAMPPSEIATYESIYLPHPLDNDKVVKDKIKRLKGFLSDYLETLDPNSRIRSRLKKTMLGRQGTSKPLSPQRMKELDRMVAP